MTISHREGSEVAFAGNEGPDLRIGDVGKVLASNGGHDTHVRWESGDRQGQVDLVAAYDLVPHVPEETQRRTSSLDDSLEYGSLVAFSAREVYDTSGANGLLDALSEEGHLAGLSEDAEEMLGSLVARVRADVSVQAVAVQLDEEEAEEFVLAVANALLTDMGVSDA